MADVFLYLVLFASALWTARLAMSKGRNPWMWGGAALVLSLIPWHLLGVVPLLILLFMKSPVTSPAERANRLACPRCAKSYSDGQHFCTGCGWDLGVAYSPEEPDGVQPSPSQPQAQAPIRSTAVAEPPEVVEVPAPPAVSAAPTPSPESEGPESKGIESAKDHAPGQESGPTADEKPAVESAPASTGEPEIPAAAASAEPEEEPETAHVPWGTYVPGVAPTAAVMTARGIERFDEGKFQEAIDQFTKAIALDPDYPDAWQRRAEAYAQLGRSDQAAEDRRHHQGLDPSSSPG